MSDDYIPDVEREISALFLRAERSQARRVLPEVGRLEKTAFHLLGQLVRQGPSRPSAIAQSIRLDLSTVSRHVAALEAAGLVARDDDPADRRACLLRATEHGEEILSRLRAVRRQRMRTALADWSAEDRRELVRLLGRLNHDLERLDEIGESAAAGAARTPSEADPAAPVPAPAVAAVPTGG